MTDLDALTARVEANPDDGDAWLSVAEVHFESGRVVAACRAWANAYRLWAGPFVDDRFAGPYAQKYSDELRRRGDFGSSVQAFRRSLVDGRGVDEAAFGLGVHLLLGTGHWCGGWIDPAKLADVHRQIAERLRERPRHEPSCREAVRTLVLLGEHARAVELIDTLEGLIGTVGGYHVLRQLLRALIELARRVEAGEGTAGWRAPSLLNLWEAPRPEPTAAWEAAGVDRETAASFLKHRIGPTLGRPFAGAGVDPAEAAAWLRTGRDPEEALLWRGAGFDPIGAATWSNKGFEPRGAERWRRASFSAGDAARWRQVFYEPERAQSWRPLGRADQIRPWVEADFQPDQAELWLIEGVNPRDAARWRDAGFDAFAASELRSVGQNVVDAARRLAMGFTFDEVLDQARRKLSVVKAVVERLRLPGGRPTPKPRGTEMVAFVFWGIVLPDDEPPWTTERDREKDTDLWPQRLLRRRGDVAVEALGCCIDRYGRPANWSHPFAAIGESLCWSTGQADWQPPTATADWAARLRRFSRVLDLPWSEPGWHLAAVLEE